LAQAEKFLEAGSTVVGVDIHDCDLMHDKFTFIQADVSSETDVERLKNSIGAVDILCNTAGILDDYKPTLEIDLNYWNHVLTTNLTSMFLMTNAFLPQMIEQGGGVIINMASIASLVAGGGGAAYTASKHAIAGYTKQLALDYADKNIFVKAIAPGAIRTPMNRADFEGDGEMAKWVASETPVKRWAEATEVAELTLFLASEKSSYMQGAIIPIDGGWTLK
jgi:3-oxoacyl-[acyl-carrier protein] reductase